MSELRSMYQEAFDAFARGEYETAVSGFERVIAHDPKFALAYQGLAETHAKKGDLDSAVDAIRKAIECEADEPLYRTSLSRFYQMQGRIPEAEEEAAAAARLQSAVKL